MRNHDFSSTLANKWKSLKRRHIWLGILSLVGVLFLSKLLYGWISTFTVPAMPAISIQTISAKTVSMPIVYESIGDLRPLQSVKIKAMQPGKVGRILVEGGAWVKQGTSLITLIAGPEVRAPFDGYLTDWKIKPADAVDAGDELVEIVNADQLELSYEIPEEFAPKLDLNQKVILKVRAFPGKDFLAKLSFISPVVNKKTYTILVKALIDNPTQDLWPGMSAHVQHIFDTQPNAVAVPEAALVLTLEGYELLVVDNGKLAKRKVTVGLREQGRAHILSNLQAGEQVLLTQTWGLREGMEVTAQDWSGDW